MIAIIWGIDGVGEAVVLLILGSLMLSCVPSVWRGRPPPPFRPRPRMECVRAYGRWLGGCWHLIVLLTFSSALVYGGGWIMWRAIDIRTVKLTVPAARTSHYDSEGDSYTIRDAAGKRYAANPAVYHRLREYGRGARVSCRVMELALLSDPSLRSCRLLSRPRPAKAADPAKHSAGDRAAHG